MRGRKEMGVFKEGLFVRMWLDKWMIVDCW